jgi:hypothetical protein
MRDRLCVLSDFLTTDSEISGSIPEPTSFSET